MIRIPGEIQIAILWWFASGAIFAALSFYGIHTHKQSEWQSNLIAANERAAHYQLAYDATAQAWEDRAYQFVESEQTVERLRGENEALARDLERREAVVLSLQRSVSRLETELDESDTEVHEEGPESYMVHLDEAVELAGGGRFSVYGQIQIRHEPLSVATDLTAAGEFPLSIVISESPEGDIIVNAFTGDPRLTVTRLDVDWRATPPRFSTSFLDGFTTQLFGASPWINRAIGFGVCAAVFR